MISIIHFYIIQVIFIELISNDENQNLYKILYSYSRESDFKFLAGNVHAHVKERVYRYMWVCISVRGFANVYKHRVYTPSVRSALIPILDATHTYVCTYTGCTTTTSPADRKFRKTLRAPIIIAPVPIMRSPAPATNPDFRDSRGRYRATFIFFLFLSCSWGWKQKRKRTVEEWKKNYLSISKIRMTNDYFLCIVVSLLKNG